MNSVGGLSSIIYSLKVAKSVGIKRFYKAITSKNSCKTCAFGTGGQAGAMRNEAGDFPQVCKKGMQAQLTDIQNEIPLSFFKDHTIDELKSVSPMELERSGRLNHPLYKEKGGSNYVPISWDEAIGKIANQIKQTKPERSFFYSSGRSSNEAAFVLQLFARSLGCNNVSNCAYYCHQASGVGMSHSVGSGTATIRLEDLKNCDLIFVIGANPSSNHPRYMTELMECRRRGGNVIVINPAKEPGLVRFTIPSRIKSIIGGGSRIASLYIQPNIGGDIALLKGIAKVVIDKNGEEPRFITAHTNNYDEFRQDVVSTSWDEIVNNCGVGKDEIDIIADMYMASNNTVFSWAMGITQHEHGVDNVEAITNLALLRGMVGKQNSGLLPLRGHSNVQGIASVGFAPALKDEAKKALEAKLGTKMPSTPGQDTMASMKASAKGEIEFAFILGGNLYASNPDPEFAEATLNKVGFKVFLNTTLNQGHLFGVVGEAIILPVCARDEERQPTTQESMFNFVRLSDGGIGRLDNVRPETDIICSIAAIAMEEKKSIFDELKNHSNIRKSIAHVYPALENLADIDITKKEFHIPGRTFHQPHFATKDGKANFVVVSIPVLKGGQGAFRLTTVRSEGQFNSIIYEESDTFRGQTERWIVMMNKEDMTTLGLKENDFVTLENETGRMENVKVREYSIAKGNLMAYYPEANRLVSTTTDSRSKTPSFKSVTVRVRMG